MNKQQWTMIEQMNQMKERWHWTIPLGADEKGELKLGYLVLPERHLSEWEWQQLMKCIEIFKPGLVAEVEPEPQGDMTQEG